VSAGVGDLKLDRDRPQERHAIALTSGRILACEIAGRVEGDAVDAGLKLARQQAGHPAIVVGGGTGEGGEGIAVTPFEGDLDANGGLPALVVEDVGRDGRLAMWRHRRSQRQLAAGVG